MKFKKKISTLALAAMMCFTSISYAAPTNDEVKTGLKEILMKYYNNTNAFDEILKLLGISKDEPAPVEPEDPQPTPEGTKYTITASNSSQATWGNWAKWTTYKAYVYNIPCKEKPSKIEVKANGFTSMQTYEMIGKQGKNISASWYNGNIQVFIGIKDKSELPIDIYVSTGDISLPTPVEPTNPTNPITPTEPTKPTTPTNPSNPIASQDWDLFNNTYGNKVIYKKEQVALNGKDIKITAVKKPGSVNGVTKQYTSGGLVSKKAYRYGTFTFKFKLSANNTYLWPMIWTLPDLTVAEDGLVGTNQRPEYDLLESWGSYTGNSIIQTYHTTTSAGKSLTNYKQARTPVDLTKEHEVKMVWTKDNVVKMYVDGQLKLTLTDYLVNHKTGKVDYQVFFLNLGLGTYDGKEPNGTGWFEITDYKFEPVESRNRVKQNYGYGNFCN